MFIKFIMILLILLSIFASISHIIWGPYLIEFSRLDISFVNILFMSVGYYDFKDFLKYEQFIAVLFMCIFYLFFFCVVYSSFIAFYSEGLRLSVIKNGYPNEVELAKWTLKDYMAWITNKKQKNKK
jgi:hypothetical protein